MSNEKNNFCDSPIIFSLSSLYEKMHKLILSFPKYERYSIGERLETSILECLEFSSMSITATKYERERYLTTLSAKIDTLKIIVRISFNLKFITFRQYIDIEKNLSETGKMVGGWIRSTRGY